MLDAVAVVKIEILGLEGAWDEEDRSREDCHQDEAREEGNYATRKHLLTKSEV